jgi:protein kinase C substrate 80K-H
MVPFTQVNDDYCDCGDGSDEPGTSACSNGKFTCPNVGYVERELHASKVNDGICDCCDGSDEYGSGVDCVKNCFELGEAAREAYRRQQEDTRVGSELREQYKQQAKARREEIARQVEELQQQTQQLAEEKQQKADSKQAAEDEEKLALDQHAVQVEARRKEAFEQEQVQQARDREHFDAVEAFRTLDTDQDGIVTYTELIASGRFDQNEDGTVSDSEARFFLAQKDKMDLEEFVTLGWILAKPFYQKQKVYFIDFYLPPHLITRNALLCFDSMKITYLKLRIFIRATFLHQILPKNQFPPNHIINLPTNKVTLKKKSMSMNCSILPKLTRSDLITFFDYDQGN